jgi:hypothetical protein
MSTLAWFLVGLGIWIVALNLGGFAWVLIRFPIPKGVPFLQGLRASMIAYGGRAAWAVRHPWRMVALSLAVWLFGSIGAAGRWDFYSTH